MGGATKKKKASAKRFFSQELKPSEMTVDGSSELIPIIFLFDFLFYRQTLHDEIRPSAVSLSVLVYGTRACAACGKKYVSRSFLYAERINVTVPGANACVVYLCI